MQPGPLIDPSVKVVPALIRTDGDTFHVWPRSRAAFLPVPSVAMPALPFSPVKFSGLIDRDRALERRCRLPRFWSRLASASAAKVMEAVVSPTRNWIAEGGFIGVRMA